MLSLDRFGIAEMDMPEIAGKYAGRLLVVASGRCVWDDLEPFSVQGGYEAIRFDGDILAVNDIGMHFPGKIAHWYSNDAYMLPRWKSARRPEYRDRVDGAIVTHSNCPAGHKMGADWCWPWPGHGGSGLQAVYTGLGLGYDEILIAGMPADDSGHYFDPPWVGTTFSKQVPPQRNNTENRWWKNARIHMFEGRVKAMSGRPAHWLGRPAIASNGTGRMCRSASTEKTPASQAPS